MATISYYDNVKDNVENKGGASGGNFDTLKRAAEKHSEEEKEEKQKGDGTSIEILEDGLSRQRQQTQRTQSSQEQSQSGSESSSSSNPLTNNSSDGSQSVDADMSGVEDKLDKIIEQNQRMIDILESFGE